MANIKIKFLKDYEQFDEVLKEFTGGQVCSMNEASAMHYVNRNVAEVVGSRAKVGASGKPKAEDPPKKDQKKKDPPKDERSIAEKLKAGAKNLAKRATGSDEPPVHGKAKEEPPKEEPPKEEPPKEEPPKEEPPKEEPPKEEPPKEDLKGKDK